MGPVNSSRRHDDRPPHRVPPDSRAVPLPALCARADPLSRYRQRSLAEPGIRGLRMHALRLRPFREIHALTTTLTHTWLRSLTRLRGPAVEDPHALARLRGPPRRRQPPHRHAERSTCRITHDVHRHG